MDGLSVDHRPLTAGLALAQGAPKPPVKGDPVERPTLTPSSNPTTAPKTPAQVGAKKPVQAPLPPGLVRPGLPSQPAVPTRPQVIVAEPPTIELGEFSTSETKPGTVVLRNTSDSPVTVRSAKASCGCTTADFKRNTVLGPGEETEVTIRMRGGPAAKVLNKTVTFTIDGYPQLKVPIKGRSILYVEMKPGIVGSQLNPDGKLVFESIDGQPFKITTVSPPVIDGISTEKKARHEATINWEKFMEVGAERPPDDLLRPPAVRPVLHHRETHARRTQDYQRSHSRSAEQGPDSGQGPCARSRSTPTRGAKS